MLLLPRAGNRSELLRKSHLYGLRNISHSAHYVHQWDCEKDTFLGDSATCHAFGRSTSGEPYKKLAPIRSGQSTKASRDVRFRIRSIETYADTLIRALIAILVRLIFHYLFLLYVTYYIYYIVFISVASRSK